MRVKSVEFTDAELTGSGTTKVAYLEIPKVDIASGVSLTGIYTGNEVRIINSTGTDVEVSILSNDADETEFNLDPATIGFVLIKNGVTEKIKSSVNKIHAKKTGGTASVNLRADVYPLVYSRDI